MINFLRKLFCIHVWEYEESNHTGEMFKYCRKCEKECECESK